MKLRALMMLIAFSALASAPLKQIVFDDNLGVPVRLPDGKLIALHASPRPLAHMDIDGPAQPVFLRVSTDNGAVWSSPRKVFEYESGKGSVTQQIYTLVDRAGLIHAFVARYYQLPTKVNRASGRCVLLHNAWRDGGQTWSTPRRVNFGHSYTGAINSIIQLKSGRILGALSYSTDNFLESAGQIEFRSLSFFSDDGGEPWRMGTDNIRVPFGPQLVHPGAIEPVLVELRDGRVWMIIRTQTLRFWEIYSGDGGKTWTSPAASRFMAPDSPGAILRLSDGRLILVWNDISSYPNGVTGNYRQYLYAAVSVDDGKTWNRSRRVGPVEEPDKANSRADYPFLCETADHKVLLTYYRFGYRDGTSYEHPYTELIRIDPVWLQQ
jgi:hypothetical protein